MRYLVLLPTLVGVLTAADPAPSSDVQALTARIQALEARLQVLEAGAKGPQSQGGINRALLATIVLPEKPTRDQVEDYVQRIADASRGQNRYNYRDDPQAGMLAKVGAAYVDVLLNVQGHEIRYYTQRVVVDLATEEHRSLILEKLPEMRELASVVLKRQWQDQAKEILRNGLEQESYLPADWILAAVKTGDKSFYPLFLRFFEEGNNRRQTYDILKTVRDLELGPSIAVAWNRLGRRDRYERREFAPIAMAQGIATALQACLEILAEPNVNSYYKDRISDALDLASRDGQWNTWTPAMLKAQPPVITWNATTRQWEAGLAIEPAKTPSF